MKQKKPLSSYVEMLRTMIAILISLIIVFAIILLISSQPLRSRRLYFRTADLRPPFRKRHRRYDTVNVYRTLRSSSSSNRGFSICPWKARSLSVPLLPVRLPGTWTFRKNGTDRGHGGCGGRRRIYLLYPGHHESKDRLQ